MWINHGAFYTETIRLEFYPLLGFHDKVVNTWMEALEIFRLTRDINEVGTIHDRLPLPTVLSFATS
jgi:hypothetical protein